MQMKSFTAYAKALTDDTGSDTGEFEAIVSVFNNVDRYRDKVIPGAFADSIESWKASGDPIPVIWSHKWADPDAHIGIVLEAVELEPGDHRLPEALKALGGLWVRGKLDVDDEDAKTARKVWRLLKGRRVTQFSFAFDVVEQAWVEPEGDERAFNELRKLAILEVGPCLIGVNSATDLLTAKAAEEDLDQRIARAVQEALAAKNSPPPSAGVSDEQAPPSEPAATPDDAKSVDAGREPMRAATSPADAELLALEAALASF